LTDTHRLLRFGVFELNLGTEELRKSGTIIRLPPQPFQLLAFLASRAGQIVTREDIQERLWSDESELDFERRINQCIKQIRTALADNANQPVYIETLRLHGYRFIAPVISKTVAAPAPRVTVSDSSGLERDIAARPEKPVGTVWIGLSKEHYGIHGTPDPGISGTANQLGASA